MQYGRSCFWIAAGLCLIGGFGCRKKPGEQMDLGRFEGQVYHNDYLGFEITVPTGWSIQDQETAKKMMHTGVKIAAGGDENVQAALEAGESRTFNLFTAFQYPQGAPVESNPYLICVAEGVGHLPGIQTGGDYLFHVKRTLQGSALRFAYPREVYTETVAGVAFHVLATELAMPERIVKNDYYAAIRKGYALLLILKYSTDEEKAMLLDALKTAKFNDQL